MKLVPPNITPGKRQFVKIDGDRHLKINGETIVCDMQYYPWVDFKDEDWKMMEAAPLMAEALAELCVDAEYALRKFLPPGSYSMSHSLRNALDALKAAGYTVAADQE